MIGGTVGSVVSQALQVLLMWYEVHGADWPLSSTGLMAFKEPEGQVARWLEELQSYNFSVEHRAGARHTNADALSRRPCAHTGCLYCEKRESREGELRAEEEDGSSRQQEDVLLCRELQLGF